MSRLVIVGIGGSGKSTLARSVVARTGGSHIALDQIAWRGVRRLPDVEVEDALRAWVAQEVWVVEGTPALASVIEKVVLPRADELVWLDLPAIGAARRVLGRGRNWAPTAVRIVVESPRSRRRARTILQRAAASGLQIARLARFDDVDEWTRARHV